MSSATPFLSKSSLVLKLRKMVSYHQKSNLLFLTLLYSDSEVVDGLFKPRGVEVEIDFLELCNVFNFTDVVV
jgi:hypothetical protein